MQKMRKTILLPSLQNSLFCTSVEVNMMRWSIEALRQVKSGLPSRVTIDVLRQVAKSCVVKREFKRAGLLARQAVYLTKDVFDKDHPKYSDSLLDYGFFLLNFDSIRQSVVVYEKLIPREKKLSFQSNCDSLQPTPLVPKESWRLQPTTLVPKESWWNGLTGFNQLGSFPEMQGTASDHCRYFPRNALDIRKAIFGKFNLHVAVAHEDLAYALYVYEYSSGRFLKAREHAEKAIIIMEKLLPPEHLMLASVKRVKALILEEIALDTMINNSGMHVLLSKAEDLHMSALKLAMATFGEKNVQTAKHFGNLGRLYQSMKKFQEAETMHLKAIAIKEELLGAEDYEVGLSIGHLASLYNYHMKKHKKAEQLYLRSIAISLKLFGESYSGLEYDYRGLVHVYHELEDVEKVAEYTYILNNWKIHRELHAQREDPPIDQDEAPWPIEEITRRFFSDK
ncbi:Amyloid protein-binding protein 2 [Blattella germanica]|nr:Amyloid protein-binding protein 2 [Blattella germanica]